jgi:hypothetical protein
LFVKTLLGLMLAVALLIAAGLSGLSFRLWPTGFDDRPLAVTPLVIQHLRDLQAEHKFSLDPRTFYPGAPNDAQRRMLQAAVDAAIQSLVAELPAHPQRSTVLRTMKTTLANFDPPDSEERDQMLVYLTRAMEICGVESSSELFNVWRYGFPFGWVLP